MEDSVIPLLSFGCLEEEGAHGKALVEEGAPSPLLTLAAWMGLDGQR